MRKGQALYPPESIYNPQEPIQTYIIKPDPSKLQQHHISSDTGTGGYRYISITTVYTVNKNFAYTKFVDEQFG